MRYAICCAGWWPIGLLAICLHALPAGADQPAPEQMLYWWQDELRTVAAGLAQARDGKMAQWPKMIVPAGSGVLPLPAVTGPIDAEGLDTPAWQQATCVPLGPLFDAWTAGPFYVELLACRDAKNAYLAIRSPRDLAGLRALTPAGELLVVQDRPLLVGVKGGLAQRRVGEGYVIQWSQPLAGPLTVSLPVELLRRPEGGLPPAARCLGLDEVCKPSGQRDAYRHGSQWLAPITLRLVPAKESLRVALPAEPAATEGVTLWRHEVPAAAGEKPKYFLELPRYCEPIAETLAAARRIAQRADAKPASDGSMRDVGLTRDLENELKKVSRADRAAWRDLYCRARRLRAEVQLSLLDAPLLLIKQHPYFSGHIYDDFYPWHPGGGIYVIDRPGRYQGRTIRPVIDPTTNETLGEGVYRDPDLSWDADRIVFAYKGQAQGVTSLYLIGLDGRGLRRLTDDETHSDYQPAWLPDDRIVFISTRPRALVPCFNSGVGTLHTVRADGSELTNISVNNVNEFNPSLLPDGRILYGRWEYVDKTALYMQSLWTVSPDGRGEEALFANNLARPTALLDAKPVPGTHLVAATLTPHNGQAVGAIAMIDPRRGKDNLAAVRNFTPEYPVEMDQGLRVGPCDPRPLGERDLLVANNATGAHGIIELVDDDGERELVACDPEISCYAPTPVKSHPRPPQIYPQVAAESTGRFLVSDVYQGLEGIERGTVKRIRVVEETARTSGIPPGGRWWNQAFLVSWQGSYIVKNILGTVPVHEDGSAYFEVPSGRAVYFQALDEQNREVQRMRTFVQAAPGVTRSCIGCHEHKSSAPPEQAHMPLAMRQAPAVPEPESWGSGYIDYPSMVQPVWDRHCVRCHGGEEGFAKGMDLSGGWTWAFNISYETLIKRSMVGFLNCHNSSVHTSPVLAPRSIGSGHSSLAETMIQRRGTTAKLSAAERDLILAWMDTNCNYHGSWDYTPHAVLDAVMELKGPLSAEMRAAGCTECHAAGHVGNDWVNLEHPEWSRILRAPLAASKGQRGLPMCRDRKAREGYPLVNQSVQPPDVQMPSKQPDWDPSGPPHVSFASTDDPHYQALLATIRRVRSEVLARPRVDMPGAVIEGGVCRMRVPPPLPQTAPEFVARAVPEGWVELTWPRSAETIGLEYEIHRGAGEQFTPDDSTRLGLTTAGRFADFEAPAGRQSYALVVASGALRARPAWARVDVPPPAPLAAPTGLKTAARPAALELSWLPPEGAVRFEVERAAPGSAEFASATAEPLACTSYAESRLEPGATYRYRVRALDRRGRASDFSSPVEGTPAPRIAAPVFTAMLDKDDQAKLVDGSPLAGKLQGGARVRDGALATGSTGFVSFEHRAEFDLSAGFSVQCRVLIEQESKMPVVLACGEFGRTGWFLQRYGHGWRWHLGGASCDGGTPVVGRWLLLTATFDGHTARLYQDARQVAEAACDPNPAPCNRPLIVGQYSAQAPPYQVEGRIREVKIYQRALEPEEIAAAAQKQP